MLLVSSLTGHASLFALRDVGDISHYFDYAHKTFSGEVPYRDFRIEYPPGFVPIMLAAGPADGGYYERFRFLMLALAVGAVVLLAAALYLARATAAELAAGVVVLATLPRTLTSDLVLERFDVWPMFLVLLAVVALLSQRRTLGLAALGVGAIAKFYPLALVPVALLSKRGRAHWRREVLVVVAVAVLFLLPFALLTPRGTAYVGWLLVRRPLHIESLGGSILLAAHQLGLYEPTVYLSFGASWDLAGFAAKAAAAISSLLGAAALAAVWLLFARGPRGDRDLLLAIAAAVVAFVAFGKVLSPQYLVWVAGAVPLALGRPRYFALPAFVVAALLTRYVYLEGYDDLLDAGPVSWVMLIRNLLLVAIFCSLLVELATRGRTAAA
jgi:hypothetical protein